MIPDLDPSKLMKYRAARSLKTRNTKIACIGDSTTAGTETGGTTAQVLHSWPMQLASKLAARGIPAGGNNRFASGSGTFSTLLTMDSRVTSTGAWTQGATLAVGGNAFACAATGSMTFTPQGNVTKFDIWWRDGAAGRNFTWAVDGGSTTQINSSGTTQVVKTTVSAGSAASHALTLAWVAGSVTILGIDAYDDTASRRELSLWNWGISGATSPQLIDNTDTLTGRLAEIPIMAPDLSIIKPMVNDWRNSVSVASAVASITTLITTCQTVGDVILVTPRFDNGVAGLSSTQEDYVTALKALGVTMNCLTIDSRSYFGSFALGNTAGWYSDTVHGDTGGAGYGEEAEQIVRALLTV
jgi:hypothetical protein